MAVLLIVGVVVVATVLYLADRVVKARAQARRLRKLTGRMAAATARVDQQQQRNQAQAQASAALTSVMPAIRRPPLSLPGLEPHGPAKPRPACERPSQPDHGTAPRPAVRAARRAARTGDHPVRTGDHPVQASDRPGD
ncbi:MAG: hypothetical protein ACLPKI_04280 [Streptosporangiaceae bacterium]